MLNKKLLIKYLQETHGYLKDDICGYKRSSGFIIVQKSIIHNDVYYVISSEFNKWINENRDSKINTIIDNDC